MVLIAIANIEWDSVVIGCWWLVAGCQLLQSVTSSPDCNLWPFPRVQRPLVFRQRPPFPLRTDYGDLTDLQLMIMSVL